MLEKHVGNVKKAKVNTVGYSNIMNHYLIDNIQITISGRRVKLASHRIDYKIN